MFVHNSQARQEQCRCSSAGFDVSQPLPGATDIGFYDGHVKPVHLESLWNYYWNAKWVIPSPRPGE